MASIVSGVGRKTNVTKETLKSGVGQEGADAVQLNTCRSFKFNRGIMGINYHSKSGWIRSVDDDSQAEALGLRAD